MDLQIFYVFNRFYSVFLISDFFIYLSRSHSTTCWSSPDYIYVSGTFYPSSFCDFYIIGFFNLLEIFGCLGSYWSSCSYTSFDVVPYNLSLPNFYNYFLFILFVSLFFLCNICLLVLFLLPLKSDLFTLILLLSRCRYLWLPFFC